MKKKKHIPKGNYDVRMHSYTRTLAIAVMVVFCVVIVVGCGFFVLRALGKNKLYQKNLVADTARMTERLQEIPTEEGEATTEPEEEVLELQEGQIFLNGKVYQYNEDLLTFLCIGVDGGAFGRSGITKEKTPGKGGQADTLMLVILNPDDSTMKVVAVNRDAMTNIQLYDTDGNYAGEEYAQLTLQYAYGDGRDRSCELMEKTVSELFYGIPIHGYVAVDMSTIATLTDSVGGVPVTMPEDMTRFDGAWTEGAQVTLQGEKALRFVQFRDAKSAEQGTNLKRLKRQKAYLMSFVNQGKKKVKADITFPVKVYQNMKGHIVTSLTVDEITYLAGEVVNYPFSEENILSLEGTYEFGEKHEEFYLDESKLKSLIIDTFYEEVEP